MHYSSLYLPLPPALMITYCALRVLSLSGLHECWSAVIVSTYSFQYLTGQQPASGLAAPLPVPEHDSAHQSRASVNCLLTCGPDSFAISNKPNVCFAPICTSAHAAYRMQNLNLLLHGGLLSSSDKPVSMPWQAGLASSKKTSDHGNGETGRTSAVGRQRGLCYTHRSATCR